MRPSAFLLAPFVGLATLLSVSARSSTGDRVLVVLEPSVKKDDYSKFWASLQERGFELTFKEPKDRDANLVKYGETQYDHLIVYAPSAKSFSPSLSPKSIIQAQYSGINTLFFLSPELTESTREFMREYDLEFVDPSTTLIDAFSHPSGSPASTVLLSSTSSLVPNNGEILSPSTLSGGPIVYPSGTVHVAGQNPYLVDVLHASKTSYVGQDKALSGDEAEVEKSIGGKGKEPVVSGKKASLVSALQSRDNVRIGFVGSGGLASDEWWGKSVQNTDGKTLETGNAAFITDFTKWIFQETGVVKIVDSTHFREGEVEPREMYTKKDEITYSLTLAKHYTTSNGTSAWGPFEVDDIQLDFTMLDPHIRTALVQDKSATPEVGSVYAAKFNAPDRHGVFKFVVEYWRPGWTYIRTSTKASVVPLRHDEYPRFITGAWPYYIATISTSITFLLFCGLWVSLAEQDKKKVNKGKKAE
ncbi:oligosaccharyltransferase complex subunit beta [Kwoniella heveanensis BCC8398]|uniref:Dolichyl-diphosphooligosaccharide--protein glycosyltransferase subunit WBP1 n=1 Tax=Kwoniella heveanensis BCC8398 TaxID=1296120 RepID=A0A1B9GYV6_9TREE|nr:oligosaccharyltransferase complex subunit beta [Kwoniella heveanensis BCC8398]